MAAEDSRAPFFQEPWMARMINQPNIAISVPFSRSYKRSTEDSLYAETLKSPRAISSCIVFYTKPPQDTKSVEEVNVAFNVGDGMNGHPDILHGGITATLCDEAMGMYQSTNCRLASVPMVPSFTAELKVTYLKPVTTPGAVLVTVKRIKKEGRKEWLRTEVQQWRGNVKGEAGEIVVCAIAEGLFITAKGSAKL